MDLTLTELCQDIHNWFEREKFFGTFEIRDGQIYAGTDALPIVNNQYFRIVGSLFNDGVHKAPDSNMIAETFSGSVWSMAVPPPVINLSTEIAAWRAKYEGADSQAMSPFMSESFGGYSYQKGSALSSSDTSGGTSWKRIFAGKLNAWRKLQ